MIFCKKHQHIWQGPECAFVGIDVFTCSYKEYGEHNLEGNTTVDKYLTNRVVWF